MRGSVTMTSRRGYADARKRTVVVTGASRGIGYAITKQITNVLDNPAVYGTSTSSPDQLNELIREEVDSGKGKCVSFKTMEVIMMMMLLMIMMKMMTFKVTNTAGIMELRNLIEREHGQVDILINNAGKYFYPTTGWMDAAEHFVQVQRTMDINYWGLKNVVNSFLPLMSDFSRIVNMSSYHGCVSHIPGRDLQMQLGDPSLTEKGLDDLVMDYQRRSTEYIHDFEEAGWPRCAYTVSKVAVNAYTRILQRQLDEMGREGIIVNSVHPSSYHSKITDENVFATSPSEAAKAVVSVALMPHPCDDQFCPRAKFLGHHLQEVDWDREGVAEEAMARLKAKTN